MRRFVCVGPNEAWQAMGYSLQGLWEGMEEKKQVWHEGVKALRRNLFVPQMVKVKSMNGTSSK